MKPTPARIPAHVYIFLSSLALYLFSLQRNFSAAHDSITYLNNIVSGTNLFHPHHLLYNFTARCWLLLVQTVLPSASDYIVIEMLSALCGSGVLTICYLFMVRRAGLPGTFSSISTAIIAFSYGVWSYSSNIEVYAPAVFFALLVLYRVTNTNASRKYHVGTAIYTSLAILYHQVHVLLLIVTLIHLYRLLSTEQFAKLFWPFTLTVITIVGISYLVAAFAFSGVRNLPEFFDWVTLYAHGHQYWRPPAFSSIILVLVGFLHSLIGGQFIFNLPIQSLTNSRAFSGHKLADEKFLVRDLQAWQSIVLFAFTLVIVAALIYLVLRLRSGWLKQNPVLRPLVTAFVVYSAFFVFWMPENLEFWIFQSILCWIILLCSAYYSSGGKRLLVLSSILAGVLFITNYGGSIFWLQNLDNDWYYNRVRPVIPTGTSSDLVICKDPWILSDYVQRFTDCRQPLGNNRNQLLNSMNSTLKAKGRVFIFSEKDPNQVIHTEVDMILFSVSQRLKLFSKTDPPIYILE